VEPGAKLGATARKSLGEGSFGGSVRLHGPLPVSNKPAFRVSGKFCA